MSQTSRITYRLIRSCSGFLLGQMLFFVLFLLYFSACVDSSVAVPQCTLCYCSYCSFHYFLAYFVRYVAVVSLWFRVLVLFFLFDLFLSNFPLEWMLCWFCRPQFFSSASHICSFLPLVWMLCFFSFLFLDFLLSFTFTAMAMEIPVIAANWSGPTQFVTVSIGG